jgi:dihydrofolate reductase
VKLALIAAVARNGAIGKDNDLPWHEPEDQKHFRRVTMGCPVLMGRRTWDSLPARFRPLPGRRNIVITRDPQWKAEGAETATSLDAAIAMAQGAEKAFVIGGGQVYAQALPLADELVLTEIDHDIEGDTFFPAWDRAAFEEVSRESRVSQAGWPYHFVVYRRRPRLFSANED